MLMEALFLPILVVPVVPHDDVIRLLHREGRIDIRTKSPDNIWKIFEHCNGYNNISKISELSGRPISEVTELITKLVDFGVIVDSREQFMHFHRISSYPTSFNRHLTQDEIADYTHNPKRDIKDGELLDFGVNRDSVLFSIRSKRRSCRSYSNKKLTIEQIGNICHYAYSIKEHSVPSGGALYPLRIYVLVEEDQININSGYYEYDAEREKLILFNSQIDREQLKYCFNQESLPFGSSVQIIIAANLKRQTFKYANRGYRLTLIEVGHVAEIISLYCAEQNLSSCELGGLLDEPLRAELGLDDVYPILAIAVGYASENVTQTINKMRFVENIISSPQNPIDEYVGRVFGEKSAFFCAKASFVDHSGSMRYGGGTSTSYTDAVFKAVVEGYERWASSQINVDIVAKARDLKKWLDPRTIVSLTDKQIRECKIKQFDENLILGWKLGKRYDETDTYIPSDLVYYGAEQGSNNRICFSNSSGVAAYTSFNGAEEKAIVELIERDALMRNWYKRESPGIIDESALPVHARKRIAYWGENNRKVIVLEMPSNYGYVINVISVADEYPFFVSGAAATIKEDCIEPTIYKAFQEMEYRLLAYGECNEVQIIEDPILVKSARDHGIFYASSKERVDDLSWLWSGQKVRKLQNRTRYSIRELREILDTYTVDLSIGDVGLKVVRVISTKLIPINFGFYSMYYTHPELRGEIHSRSLELPHYFA